MSDSVIGIHPIHRKMAVIWEMITDVNGNTVIGSAEMQQFIPLLKQNYELVRKLDELKQLSFVAYELGDLVWQQDICKQIDELESAMEI